MKRKQSVSREKDYFVSKLPLPQFGLWEKLKQEPVKKIISFDLEITSRCNNNCRHCYINLPAGDNQAKERELRFEEIKKIVDQAVSLGALWCLITGGEPLLREDFFDIYLYLKRKGLLVSVFTNATLITEKHIDFFIKYPPRDIEVSVYGVTADVYEGITRSKGSFAAFKRSVELLLKNNIKVRFKAVVMRSNLGELKEIAEFCRSRTKDYFRFDPLLHLRFDRNSERNDQIKSERLSPEEIARIEMEDPERSLALKENCHNLILPEQEETGCRHLIQCGAGEGSFTVSSEGYFRLCSSLWHPQCIYDLKKGSLSEALYNFVPQVREISSSNADFLNKCRKCTLINLCLWCPAHSYLETGRVDTPVDYFCSVAHARAQAIEEKSPEGNLEAIQ